MLLPLLINVRKDSYTFTYSKSYAHKNASINPHRILFQRQISAMYCKETRGRRMTLSRLRLYPAAREASLIRFCHVSLHTRTGIQAYRVTLVILSAPSARGSDREEEMWRVCNAREERETTSGQGGAGHEVETV